ncbi:MAG: 16S rRNA (cytosine(1402)-N(4))-methyltransferase RsmH, partial [Myxococcales bacterium]
EKALARILDSLGEERFARPIARAIHAAWREKKIADTRELAEVVSRAIPRKAWPRDIHPATRTFQALRIAVNDELGALGDWLSQLPRIVARGGRAAAISFHSLEDRMVKQGFAKLATGCICPPRLPVCACGRSAQWKLLTKKAVGAGEEEISSNPRARSARLRAVARLS